MVLLLVLLWRHQFEYWKQHRDNDIEGIPRCESLLKSLQVDGYRQQIHNWEGFLRISFANQSEIELKSCLISPEGDFENKRSYGISSSVTLSILKLWASDDEYFGIWDDKRFVFLEFNWWIRIKVKCFFAMVLWSEFRMEQYRDDHREDAPHFIRFASWRI